MKNRFIYLAIIAAGFASCEPEFENEVNAEYSAGDADFSSYVAVGNSLTAGYMDGTVSRVGQTYSFPNLLAQKFALVGGGEFTQPSYADDISGYGGLKLGGQIIVGTRRIIDASAGGVEYIGGTADMSGPVDIEISNPLQQMAYNNMGVPGAKSFHLLAPGYGNLAGVAIGQSNPYFVRHATSASATVLGDAMSKNPTFFTNWIGANDVLSYATNGGAQSDGVTPAADHNTTGNMNPNTYGANDITNSNYFAGVYSNIINTLTSNGAKGVVATVPSVTSIPYFTTVKWNPLPAEATSTNAIVIGLYQFLSVATGGRISALNTSPGTKNPVLINDADLSSLSAQITAYANASGDPLLMANSATLGALYGKARHATSSDLVVLPASGIIGVEPDPANPMANPFDVAGVTLPLANKYVLTSNEKAKVATATAAYNSSIRSIAAANGLAVADMNAIMNQLVNGLQIETGQIYTANYFSGVATENKVLFSLDGVHPNARGYAVIANEIIKVINEHYNANLPLHYVNNFPGINIVGSN
ncbi:G-D-S-L family lipolytic protein [Flavobacterium sp. UBA6195]|uniref:G-D-S-L family lipolytic protein n=1 Tax=Flavobacterium sp. UBA6195 TaxID=1946554 RepID=UPI0025C350FB|nr:G-D-S-L family lipolytic protein [Flavobacterium sp. UBA6195]